MLLEEVYPQPHPQRQVLALGHDGKDAVGRGGKVVQHADQLAAADVVHHFPSAAPGQTQAAAAPVVQHLTVAAVQPPGGTQVLHLAVHPEGPAAGLAGVGAQGQAFVARQLGGVTRNAGPPQVGRCGHAQAAVVGQAHADQAGVAQVAHPHRAVEAFIDDVHHPVAEVERHAHVRMPRQEVRHQRRHVAAAEAGRGGDPQMAAGLDAARGDAGFGIVELGEQALAVFQEGAAFMRQAQAAGGAQQQLHPEPGFQRVQPPAHHRRGHAFRLRGGGEATLGGHQHEGLHLFETIHEG